jgi:L-serine dehydratase
MNNEKLSLAQWIAAAEQAREPFAAYVAKLAAAELETADIALLAKMGEMLQVMEESIAFGLSGVKSRSGLTGGSAKILQAALAEKRGLHLLGPVAEDAVIYALAVAESNAAMGRIVAAPTAGASGVLPGVLFALKKHGKYTELDLEKALVVAGGIGQVIASRASLAGATGGCQAECGSAAAMAAGAAVQLLGGSGAHIGVAVSIVFKNILGLVCDPVAGLVEVPCIKRNGACALQALLAAELALAGCGQFHPGGRGYRRHGPGGQPVALRLKGNGSGRYGHDADGAGLG